MKGDFSKWGLDPTDNFSGVLHQQGRVQLDQDLNASTQIHALWKETVGQDVIGNGLAAVPAAAPDGLKITSATATDNGVDVVLNPGRAWIDGVHLQYDGAVPLHAEYFGPPIQSPQESIASIAAGTRDAVVLEVWDEAFSAYQAPLELLEPALGGPDTTKRVKTCMAVKLLRLVDGQDCGDLAIEDDFSDKGKLTVTPSPTTVIAGPCPVPDSGGYSGFEHYLYRIEIATPTATDQARFKWSQFNGGLVGRGQFTAGGAPNTGTVAITANNPMINQSGLDAFYLEALAFDPAFGHWHIVCTADATLVSSDTLSLTALSGAWPTDTSGNPAGFFRLWNGIDLISNHPTGLAIPNPLNDGILLEFDSALANNSNYTPGDYWTFPARAASVTSNPALWPTRAEPEGVHYHRAALGTLEWTGPGPIDLTPDNIHDCRQVFLPLAKTKTCCTITVGDGKLSFGQFTSVQAAVNALPAQGGTVCVLKGSYDESIIIDKRVGIRVHGCGPGTRIRAIVDSKKNPQPAFMIKCSDAIVLEDMAIEAGPRSAVQIDNARHVSIRRCLIQMRDLPTLWQAIYSRGDDILIAENTIEVLPRDGSIPAPSVPPEIGSSSAPAGVNTPPAPVNIGFATRGGIQLAGGSDRVRIIDNIIQGGIWNGITLGSLVAIDNEDEDLPDRPSSEDKCDPCKPADTTDDDPGGGRPKFVSAGDLYDIEISRNRITDMGINGIGVVRFFDLLNSADLVSVHNLHIYDNFITRCIRRDIAKVRKSMEWLVAYGGIALAKVSDLRILRNEIINNGPSHRVPICGVYAIMVQGLQLDDNRIINNGQRSKEPVDNLQAGIRGGVHVWIVLPAVTIPTPSQPIINGAILAVAPGRSKIALDTVDTTVLLRDNIIVAPVGRAVTFFALGSVAVARNRLVTQSTTSKGLDLLATTTLIGNLGISNEWTPGLLLFLVLKLVGKLPDNFARDECASAKLLGLLNTSSKPVTLWPPMSRNWATGKTSFTENQVSLDILDEPTAFAISSIAIFSLDDLGFTDNQCEISSKNFFVWTDVALGAGSIRVADNRFSETWLRAFLSGLSVGGMNTTTDNQSSHCLRAIALLPNMRVFEHNLALIEAFCPGECKQG